MRKKGRVLASKAVTWVKAREQRLPSWATSSAFKIAITAGTFGAVLTVFVFPAIKDIGDPEPISEQLREIRGSAADNNLTAVVARRVDLQGSDQPSYLFVFRHRSLRLFSDTRPASVSDTLRIYSADEEGQLHLDFDFQPEVLPVPVSRELREANREAGLPPPRPGEIALTFQVATIRDLDGNDRPELLGAYFQRFMTDEAPIPVVIAWSDRDGDYRLFPLLTRPPRLRRFSHPGPFAASVRTKYREPIVLRDLRSDFQANAFAVQGFGLARTAYGQPGLVTTFLGRSPSHAEPISFEVKMSIVSYEDPPETAECFVLVGQLGSKPSVLVGIRNRDPVARRYTGYFGEAAQKRLIARNFRC